MRRKAVPHPAKRPTYLLCRLHSRKASDEPIKSDSSPESWEPFVRLLEIMQRQFALAGIQCGLCHPKLPQASQGAQFRIRLPRGPKQIFPRSLPIRGEAQRGISCYDMAQFRKCTIVGVFVLDDCRNGQKICRPSFAESGHEVEIGSCEPAGLR